MIAYLKGELLSKSGDRVVVNVNGVGYEVTVTASLLATLDTVSPQAEFLIYTDVRENAISLFGFQETLEREVFLLLKKVKGVGSKLALTIVSFLSPHDLFSAIGHGDVTALQKVPGVGKKTAERLIIELREQVGQVVSDVAPTLGRQVERVKIAGTAGLSRVHEDVLLALERLGFSRERAQVAVDETLRQSSPKSTEDAGELLKRALMHV